MRNKGVKIDITRAKADTVLGGIEKAGLIPVGNTEKAPFVWIEGILHRDTAMKYDPGQIILKIPGMDIMCYKSTLFQSLNYMRRLYPQIMNVYPPTFLLPADFLEFKRQHMNICWKERCAPTWVMKPKNDCCGRGISLIQSVNEVQDLKEEYVVQQYVKPFLIDGRKFDFRIYIFVASLSPLTVFMYKEGIARFCSAKFQMPNKSNRYSRFVHLTNTAVNVENGNVDPSVFTHKVSEVMGMIEKETHQSKAVWEKIKNCARTVIVAILPKIYSLLPTPKTFERKKKNEFLTSKYLLFHDEEDETEEEKESESEETHELKKKSSSITKLPPLIDNKQIPQVSSSYKTSITSLMSHQTFPDIAPPEPTQSPQPIDAVQKEEEEHLKPRPIRARYAHVLGIDIILDSDLNPQVLELNDRPSMHVTVDFEKELKESLVSEVFEHITPNGDIYGETSKSGWSLIYPASSREKSIDALNEIVKKSKNATSFGEITPPQNDYAFVTKEKTSKPKKAKRSKRTKKFRF